MRVVKIDFNQRIPLNSERFVQDESSLEVHRDEPAGGYEAIIYNNLELLEGEQARDRWWNMDKIGLGDMQESYFVPPEFKTQQNSEIEITYLPNTRKQQTKTYSMKSLEDSNTATVYGDLADLHHGYERVFVEEVAAELEPRISTEGGREDIEKWLSGGKGRCSNEIYEIITATDSAEELVETVESEINNHLGWTEIPDNEEAVFDSRQLSTKNPLQQIYSSTERAKKDSLSIKFTEKIISLQENQQLEKLLRKWY